MEVILGYRMRDVHLSRHWLFGMEVVSGMARKYPMCLIGQMDMDIETSHV